MGIEMGGGPATFQADLLLKCWIITGIKSEFKDQVLSRNATLLTADAKQDCIMRILEKARQYYNKK